MPQLPFRPWCEIYRQQRVQAQAKKSESTSGEISDELVPDVHMDPRCWSNKAEPPYRAKPPCIMTRVHLISIWEAFRGIEGMGGMEGMGNDGMGDDLDDSADKDQEA
eukprot:TRINITY_DN39_c0_g1_i5.p1 TRINITY_DN39_c0_g1~~TRINITY_DN39_c0_g1_i5.p1  ORF type:complete len:107 (+),score=21.53 TRINITY_DN39_c0_g1_i5:412-732(+)